MALLLTGQYDNRNGETYILEIYDETTGVASGDEFQVTERLSWQWSGETKNIFQTVKSMTMQFGMNVPTSGAVRDFVNAFIIETDERRYWLKVTRGGAEFARGWLFIDQSEIPIRSRDDFPFTLSATDSLSLLSNYDYIDPATPSTPYEGTDSVKDHLIKVLVSANLDDLYGAGEVFLSTSVEYYNTSMANAIDDYSTNFLIDHRKFGASIEEEIAYIPFLEPTVVGERVVEPGKSGDVITKLCFLFNATFFHCDGQYYFISRSQILDGASIPVFNYDKAGTQLSTGSISSAVTVGSPTSNPTGYYILHDSGTYTYQPPIKRIQIQHFLGGGNNKIAGHDWDIDYNDQKCFEDINNESSATVQASLPINVTIAQVAHTDEKAFRSIIGLKLKIGTQWLIRDIKTGLDVFNGLDLVLKDTHTEDVYETPVWSVTEGYFKFIIDTGVRNTNFFFSRFPELQVYDIESPAIPESGQLCVDWDLVELRVWSSVGGSWGTPTFTDTDTFTFDGNTYDMYWSVLGSYINIQSDGSQLNEDTLAYKQVNANVNSNNTEVLEYTTEIGDDPASNTHGRIQIYNGTTNEDADGGWKFNGNGTEYDSHKEILAYDMARLRSGVVRVMRAVVTSSANLITPYTRLTFDSEAHMIGSVSVSSDSDDYQGEFYSLDDSNSGAITLDNRVYQSVGGSGNSNTTTQGVGGSGYDPPPEYYILIDGDGTDRIAIGDDSPLPNIEAFPESRINALFKKALKGSGNLIYRETKTHPSHFSIDNATNDIVLFRNSKTTDEYFFHWILPNV